MVFWECPTGKTQESLERLYLLAILGLLGFPSDKLEEVVRDRECGASLLRLLPPYKQKKVHGGIDIYTECGPK